MIQPHDIVINSREGVITLRLSLSTLKRMCGRLCAKSPTQLASRLRSLKPDELRRIVESLCVENQDLYLIDRLPEVEILKVYPKIAQAFEHAFSNFSEGVRTSNSDTMHCADDLDAKPAKPSGRTYDEPWPFSSWLRLGVIRMGMSPQEFWDTALWDWFSLLSQDQRQALNTADLRNLQAQFPDERIKKSHHTELKGESHE